jgi:hypothetical protein
MSTSPNRYLSDSEYINIITVGVQTSRSNLSAFLRYKLQGYKKSLLATSGSDIRVYDLRTKELLETIDEADGEFLRFINEHELMYTTRKYINVYNLSTKETKEFYCEGNAVYIKQVLTCPTILYARLGHFAHTHDKLVWWEWRTDAQKVMETERFTGLAVADTNMYCSNNHGIARIDPKGDSKKFLDTTDASIHHLGNHLFALQRQTKIEVYRFENEDVVWEFDKQGETHVAPVNNHQFVTQERVGDDFEYMLCDIADKSRTHIVTVPKNHDTVTCWDVNNGYLYYMDENRVVIGIDLKTMGVITRFDKIENLGEDNTVLCAVW